MVVGNKSNALTRLWWLQTPWHIPRESSPPRRSLSGGGWWKPSSGGCCRAVYPWPHTAHGKGLPSERCPSTILLGAGLLTLCQYRASSPPMSLTISTLSALSQTRAVKGPPWRLCSPACTVSTTTHFLGRREILRRRGVHARSGHISSSSLAPCGDKAPSAPWQVPVLRILWLSARLAGELPSPN